MMFCLNHFEMNAYRTAGPCLEIANPFYLEYSMPIEISILKIGVVFLTWTEPASYQEDTLCSQSFRIS
jgi:hypothetical protein